MKTKTNTLPEKYKLCKNDRFLLPDKEKAIDDIAFFIFQAFETKKAYNLSNFKII